MKRRSTLQILAMVLTASVMIVALPGQAANEFDPDAALRNASFKKELQKLTSDADAQASFMTHANQAFGITKLTFDFAAEVAAGDYTTQIEKIMSVPVQQWNPSRGMMGSYDIRNVKRIVNQNQTSSLFGRIKKDMGNVALGLSIYSVMKDTWAGYNGDSSSKLKAVKGTYDIVSGYWAQKVGWNSLGTAMLGAGVISYALDTFIAQTLGTYSDNWYQQYSAYLDSRYPDLVTGPKSWAGIAKSGGQAAIEARLNEFWNDTSIGLERPAVFHAYYADVQMGKAFAARYYAENVHTTLKTYFRMQTERAEAQAAYEAEKSYDHMLSLLADLEQLRLAIQDADSVDEEEEEEEIPISLLLRPAAKTVKVGDTVTLTSWYVFADHTLKPAASRTNYSGAASGPTFNATEAGTFVITGTSLNLTASSTITVEEKIGDDDEEDEIDEVIEEIEDPEDIDYCDAAFIQEMRATLAGLISRAQSKTAIVTMYQTKFDKELADRAADPCGNSLLAYCYTQAQLAAADLDFLVDEIRDLASSLLMIMALCPADVDAAGEPFSIRDVIKDLAGAGTANREAAAALASMQGRLGDNGCDEDEFEDLADQYTEDGDDPDGMQDGGNMTEIGGDGVDNDQDGLQEEDWTEVAGKTVTIVVYDSGNFKDDVFNLMVSGVGTLGLTPAGGLRTYGLDLAPGTYTATVTVVVAPDNCGTVTAIAMQNGVQIGALGSGESCPPVGAALSFAFTVTAPE